MNFPKISIVIPSLNKGKYIDETLASIFSQKYPNLEVIIQDGGSADGTVEIVKKYSKKYTKIIKWESKKDKGQLDAINKGMRKATGDILTYINADDLYEKEVFKTVSKAYLESVESYWFAGKGKVIDKNGKEIAKLATVYKNLLLSLNSGLYLLITNYLMQPSVFITKETYQKFGPFGGTKDFVMEYDLWLKIAKYKMPIVLNKYLTRFRIYQSTITSLKTKKLLSEDERIVRKYSRNPMIIFMHTLHNCARLVFGKTL